MQPLLAIKDESSKDQLRSQHFLMTQNPWEHLPVSYYSAAATWAATNQRPTGKSTHVSSSSSWSPEQAAALICFCSSCVRKNNSFLPQIPDVVSSPGEAHAGPAHHVDEICDTQNVLCRLKGGVPSAQDQHGLTGKILRVGRHRLITLNIL